MKRDNILSYEEVAGMIEKAKSMRDKALVSFFYITGARETEVIHVRRRDITYDDIIDMVNINIITLKRRKVSRVTERRTLPIGHNARFFDILLDYFTTIPQEDKLFPISRVHAWRIIKGLNSEAWPHLFRHTRATLLAREGMNLFQLMAWFGWTKTDTANKYIQREGRLVQDFADKIK